GMLYFIDGRYYLRDCFRLFLMNGFLTVGDCSLGSGLSSLVSTLQYVCRQYQRLPSISTSCIGIAAVGLYSSGWIGIVMWTENSINSFG
ncbi:MAG: hypothetical protein AAGJ80_04075, partial [Cyanobacteria bacterium J06553_1]